MIALTVGFLIALSIYLLFDSNAVRRIFGIIVLSNAINICIMLCGRIQNKAPAFVSNNQGQAISNSLPQALILTAIVIGFGLLTYLCVLSTSLFNQKESSS